jgi:hypothetical protein
MRPVSAPARMLASRGWQALTLPPACGSLNAPTIVAVRAVTAGPLLRVDRMDGSLACVLAVGAIAAPRRGGWCAEPPQ